MRILIVDDDESILDACEVLFISSGYDVLPMRSPRFIENTIHSFKPDLILLDFSMPPFNGCDVCRELKEIDISIPVIIFTANDISPQRVMACGADGFISKPFRFEDMLTLAGRLTSVQR